MKILRHGTIYRDADGVVIMSGWAWDAEGGPADLDEMERLAWAAQRFRSCGVCGVRDIPYGMDWLWWTDGRPIHPGCQV